MWRNSVFIFALVATTLQLISCLEGDDEINPREKRQALINIQFRPRDKAALVSIGDSPTLVQLTSYDDPSATIPATFESAIDETDSFECDLGLQTLTSPSLPAIVRSSGIAQCSIVSNGGQDVDVRTTGRLTVNETAGQLYLGPNRALFIESATAGNVISTLANAIPTLPPVLPPLDITVVERSDQLSLNVRVAVNPDERPLDRSDDVIQLTGSSCSQVEVGQSVNYRNNMLQVRQGLTLVRNEENIQALDSILERNVLGRPCLELSRDTVSRADFLPGQGWLCVGRSGIDMNSMAGFFTDSTTTMNDIVRTLVESQLTCAVTDGQPALMGTFTPNTNMVVMQLSVEDQMQYLDSATSIQDINGEIRITDSFNQNLATFRCPTGVTLSIYDDNTLMILGAGLPDPLDVTNERIVAVSNPNDCSMVFVYPRRNSEITNLIRECRSRSMITPAPPISYASAADGFGGSTFTADGVPIFSASSARAFSVGSEQFVDYDSNTVRIRMGNNDAVAEFDNVRTFTSNTATNRISMFSGSSNNERFSGPGTLYVDNDGRSFFTSVGAISNFISSIRNNVQPQRVGIVPATEGPNMTRVLNLQIGGNSFFTLSESPDMYVMMDDGMVLVYRGGTLDLLRGIRISSDASLSFTPPPTSSARGVLIIDAERNAMNFTDIENFHLYGGIGEGPNQVTTQTTLAGGGVLFRGDDDNTLIYLPSHSIVPNDFGLVSNIARIGTFNTDTFAFYNGVNVQVFNGSALSVIDGPGLLGFNNDRYFFTGDTGFIQSFSMELARLRPVSTSYMSGTGNIVITTSGGDAISSFSVGSRILQAPTGMLFYSGGSIRSSSIGNNLIASGITMLTTFDGFFTRTLTDGDMNIELEGGGLLVIDTTDPEASTAFYVTNRLVAQQVIDIVQNAMATFLRPDLVNPEPADYTSKLSEVNTGFGQLLTVYEGADVNLRCNPANANPPAEITFFSRDNFTAGVRFVPVNNSVEEEVVVNGPNDVTLRIANVNAGRQVEYMCMARNIAGVDSRITRVTVLPRVRLEIDNDLFTAATFPNEAVVTARSTQPMPTIEPILAPSNDMLRIADRSLLSSRVSIGCKAFGRPKADIVWMMRLSLDPDSTLVNLSAPTANATSRRAGQSVLTIDVEELQGTLCTVYTCVASNNRDSVSGFAQVCPQRFNAESNILPGPCSASCGIGVMRVNPEFQRTFDGVSMTVTFADLPPGLVKDQIAFCSGPECPTVEFVYMADDFDNCTNFCGRVTLMRNLTCMRLVDGMLDAIVNLTECRNVEPLPTSRVCDMGPCPIYVIGPYGPCSRTCNGGTQNRTIECLAAVQNQTTEIYSFDPGMTVDIEICYNYSRFPRPSDTMSCNSHIPCLVIYRSTGFGACDPFYCQVRDVFCSLFDPYDPTEVWQVSDAMCMEQRLIPPHTVRSCGGGVCNLGTWTIMNEGNCSRTCGVGVQERTVLCTNRSDSSDVLDEGFCDARQRPADEVECFERNCPGECVREPLQCQLLRNLRLCKMAQVQFIAVDCCISCPLQASPIPPLLDAP